MSWVGIFIGFFIWGWVLQISEPKFSSQRSLHKHFSFLWLSILAVHRFNVLCYFCNVFVCILKLRPVYMCCTFSRVVQHFTWFAVWYTLSHIFSQIYEKIDPWKIVCINVCTLSLNFGVHFSNGCGLDQTNGMGQDQQLLRKRRRGLLRMYYGVDDPAQSNKQNDVLDINSTHFKAEKYLEQLYKTCDLQHLKTEKEKTKSGKLRSLKLVSIILYTMHNC